MAKHDQFAQQTGLLVSETTNLRLKSPINGIVTTPRVEDRVGSFVREGTELAEIADTRNMRARIYVSEYDMYQYHQGSQGRLHVEGMLGNWDARQMQVSRLIGGSRSWTGGPRGISGHACAQVLRD